MKNVIKEIIDTILNCLIMIVVNLSVCIMLICSCVVAAILIPFTWLTGIRKFIAKEYEKFYYIISKFLSHDEYLDDEDI